MLEFTGERYVPSLRGQIYYEHFHRYAIAARFCKGKRVLDIASGEGYGAAVLARTATAVVGVDIDERTVEHSRASYYASNLRFMRGSVTDIPLADCSVDVVVSFETIEHVDQHERMLDEFRRVLVPDGVVVISSPNKLVYSDIPNFSNPFHVKELYFSELRDLLMRRFGHVAIYGQRVVASSVIHPLAGAVSDAPAWYNGGTQQLGRGLPTLNNPVYFVAICSDQPLGVDVSSAYVDPADDLLEDLCLELEGLRAQARRALADRPQSALAVSSNDMLTAGNPPAALGSGGNGIAQPAERLAGPEAEIQRIREQADAALAALYAQHEIEMSEQRSECEDRVAHLRAEHETALRSKDAETERLRAVLQADVVQAHANCEADRAALEATIARQGEGVAQLQRDIDDARIEAQRARDAVAVAVTEANRERARVADLMRELAGARVAATAEERRIADLVRDQDRVERENLALREQAHELTEAVQRAEQDSLVLREVLASHSWKLTMPLRQVVRFVRR